MARHIEDQDTKNTKLLLVQAKMYSGKNCYKSSKYINKYRNLNYK